MEEKMQMAIDKANKKFVEEGCCFQAEPMLTTDRLATICIDFGDWKHEHGYADYVMSENGFKKIKEKVTEEDGSDCYSAIHTYYFCES